MLDLEEKSQKSTLKAGFAAISKLDKHLLSAFLTTVTDAKVVDGTKLCVNCHHVALDGSGLPRLQDLTDNLAHLIIEYVIPRSTLQANTNDPEHVRRLKEARLRKEAIETFKLKGASGEQGELLMFVIAEAILGLPQLLCKMDLKTDSEMHFHGLDGVHCGIDDSDESLAVYWCESKVHQDFGGALGQALDGLEPFLLSPGTGDKDKKRELALLSRYMDLGSSDLQKHVLDSLDPANQKFNQVSWRGICLVGFDHKGYPTEPHKKSPSQLLSEIAKDLDGWIASAKTRIANRKLESFTIHIIFVPFGFCENFREAMLKSIGQLA